MNNLGIDDLKTENYKIIVSDNDEKLIIEMSGNIDIYNPDKFLNHYLEDIHNKILLNKIKFVECNILSLKFINSSCIHSLINWLIKINYLNENEKYEVDFIYDPNISWQHNSLISLKSLVSNINLVENK